MICCLLCSDWLFKRILADHAMRYCAGNQLALANSSQRLGAVNKFFMLARQAFNLWHDKAILSTLAAGIFLELEISIHD
jgi:hypothetical protein